MTLKENREYNSYAFPLRSHKQRRENHCFAERWRG